MKNLINFRHLNKSGENFVSFEDIGNFAYLVEGKNMKKFENFENYLKNSELGNMNEYFLL